MQYSNDFNMSRMQHLHMHDTHLQQSLMLKVCLHPNIVKDLSLVIFLKNAFPFPKKKSNILKTSAEKLTTEVGRGF
jgi:hypothetical protein